MPDIGYLSDAGDNEQGLTACRGNIITMTEAGQAGVTVTFRLRNDGGAASCKAVIFNAAGDTVLAESNTRADVSAEQNYAFSGGGLTTFTPANGTSYLIMAFSNSGSVQAFSDNVASPAGIRVSDQDASTFGPPASFSAFGPSFDDSQSIIGHMTYTSSAGSTVTKTPQTGNLSLGGLAVLTDAFNHVRIRDVLINEFGQPIASQTNIRLMVWYGGECRGAPDVSLNGQTTDANGTASWSIPTGTLLSGQHIFYVAQDSLSFSNYTCARMIPEYEAS